MDGQGIKEQKKCKKYYNKTADIKRKQTLKMKNNYKPGCPPIILNAPGMAICVCYMKMLRLDFKLSPFIRST